MKQNYILYLMGFLSISQVAFSMDVPQLVKNFRTYFNNAETLMRKGDMNAAFVQWGKAADITLPLRDYTKEDPYLSDRSKQTDAVEKLADQARFLESAGKKADALKIYRLAPRTFKSEINALLIK